MALSSVTRSTDLAFDPGTTTAIVLAAGRGERLRPFTDRLPKALVDVRGVPLLDHHLGLLREAGIRHVVLVVGYLAETIRDHVGDGELMGLEVEYVEQENPRGTGDAVAVALDRISSDPFIVAYSDVYWGPNSRIYRDLLVDKTPKLVAARVEDGGGYGRLEIASRPGRIELRAIREKDGFATPALVNGGLYLLPHSVGDMLRGLPVSPRGEIELTDAVTQLTHEGLPVGVLVADTWYDVGTLARWSAANGGVP
jgi:UDP-N-acetylglucosamine diphosphorylase / glucose-1-phosphate thymidylyltransferase / UDP-N-acetylgalactosamine diphosphorylase / glucosamine-1-phosphate N-acetyltransferase / galactosamine-1-phosphate N-acetyltransferase